MKQMKRLLFLYFALLSPFSQLFATEGIFAGVLSTNGEYHVTCTFGIEQYSPKNKLFEYRKQIWDLRCEQKKNGGIDCELERLVIDNLTQSMGKDAHITRHKHSITDGNLKLKAINLAKGILDFSITYTSGEESEVRIRITQTKRGMLYLKEFIGLGVTRGMFSDNMETYEYRIPQYSYTIQAPLEIKGMKDEASKKLDELVATLSESDKQIWKRLEEDGDANRFDPIILKKMHAAIPDYEAINKGEKKPTNEDLKQIEKVMIEAFVEWLKAIGLSEEGQKKLLPEWEKKAYEMTKAMKEEMLKEENKTEK